MPWASLKMDIHTCRRWADKTLYLKNVKCSGERKNMAANANVISSNVTRYNDLNLWERHHHVGSEGTALPFPYARFNYNGSSSGRAKWPNRDTRRGRGGNWGKQSLRKLETAPAMASSEVASKTPGGVRWALRVPRAYRKNEPYKGGVGWR